MSVLPAADANSRHLWGRLSLLGARVRALLQHRSGDESLDPLGSLVITRRRGINERAAGAPKCALLLRLSDDRSGAEDDGDGSLVAGDILNRATRIRAGASSA